MVGCLVDIVIAVVVVVVVVVLILTQTVTNKQTNKRLAVASSCSARSEVISAKRREERDRFVGWMVGCLLEIAIAVVVSFILKHLVKNKQTSEYALLQIAAPDRCYLSKGNGRGASVCRLGGWLLG